MKKIEDYWILGACSEDHSGVIEEFPEGIPEDWELRENEPMLQEFNVPIRLQFSDNYPQDNELHDFVENILSLPIISLKVKMVLDNFGVDRVEYIPAHIFNHRGECLSEEYFVINCLNVQPIIDQAKSELVMSHITPEKIAHINALHLNLSEVDHNSHLFRDTNEDSYIFLTSELVQAMKDANLTALELIKAEGWDGNNLSFL